MSQSHRAGVRRVAARLRLYRQRLEHALGLVLGPLFDAVWLGRAARWLMEQLR